MPRPFLILLALLVVVLASGHVRADDEIELGPAPLPPAGMAPITPALEPAAPATVVLDPASRSQVAAAYQTLFLAQAQVPIGWSGQVGSCNAGTTSVAYRQATIDRVNFYRALAGLPGNVSLFGGSQASGTQAAALMFSANSQLSHQPPTNWACWTSAGSAAAGSSNIALGSGNLAAGTTAVDLYMDDSGGGNSAVGHRRWLLYPPQKQMDSGSIPSSPQLSANALWVFHGWGTRPATPAGVAWPPRGYVPWQLLPDRSNRWSFSWPGASFANATVSMTRDGVPLGVPSYEAIANGYGDNTLVWKPQGVSYVQPAADVTYGVTISGISGGGAPSSIRYAVVVIDPTVLGEAVFENGFEN
jgi:hypothetical protein